MVTISSSTDSKGYTLELVLTQKSQDLASNKSVVSWLLQMKNGKSRFTTSSNKITVSINGTKVKDGEITKISMPSYDSIVTIASGEVIVPHNADGTKIIFCSASFTPSSTASYMPTSKSLSGTFELTTIARTSSITATDSNIESATSINIIRANSSYKHNLSYSFEGLTGVIATDVETSYGWIIPNSFYEKIPNSQSADCLITCDTYNENLKIGTTTTTIKISVDKDKCGPDVFAVIKDVNSKSKLLTGNENNLIKYVSNVEVELTASAKKSATIVSKLIRCGDGKTLSENGIINAVESGSFNITVTDSRSISKSKSYVLNIVDYIKLTLNSMIYRTQPTNNEVAIKFNGNYFNGNFGAINNNLSLKIRYKKSDSSEWSNYSNLTPIISGNTYSNGKEDIILGSNFDYKSSYDFEIVATDKVYDGSSEILSIIQKGTIYKGKPIIDWGKNDVNVNGNFNVNGKITLCDEEGNNKINIKDYLFEYETIGTYKGE